ncbi:MAG: sigma 54-interacting transcriptional regulator [Acidovorax sp.]|uniref:sigma-54 interaction domain-containing protein n=1 Tax=Acidovorax sp. TaxID=1872122 RepID=UPI0022BE0FC0|nr:sigma 54-interacting transcriptional regulator [Acidovorax sp.]MCZ8220154.1 sigma 54-interacting transcriptional regulator [Acidovorax sp.]
MASLHLPPPELVSFLDGLPDPHILLDGAYRILAANAAYRQQFGGGAPVVGRRCHEVSHHASLPCDQADESCPLAQARQSGRREHVLHLHHTPQGEEYVQIALAPIRGADGQAAFFVEKMVPLPLAAPTLPGVPGLVGRSPAFQRMLALVARAAPARAAVLLLGESGTGKELVARALHQGSPRAARALVPVDCASLSETLFEAELFGHEKGAFTGAALARAGLVEVADGGTLFLDEVGDIPLPQQVKLLRLLETGTYRRVGSTELRHADLRVVSATHRHLPRLVAEGRFREDLYYRLGTFPILLPPLRERQEDIALLAQALLDRLAPAHRALRLSEAAVAVLQAQPYPGNVRELRNLLERAALLCDHTLIDAEHVRQALACGLPALADGAGATHASAPPDDATLRQALASHRGSRAALARQLGISERSLYRRLRALVPPVRGEVG